MGLNSSKIFSFLQNKPKKEIKETFMPKIKRESKERSFNNKMSSNLTKYLFNFFDYKELYEMGKINLYFMNLMIDYINDSELWPEKIRKLKTKYKFQIYQNEVDQTLKEAKMKKRRYKFPSENDKQINYFQYDIEGNKYIAIARTFEWAHKNNECYWSEEKVKDSYEENGMVPYLFSVCWIDTNFTFFHVTPNNYKLYINEHFLKPKGFKEKVTLKVIIGNDCVIYNKIFPPQVIYDNNSSENVDIHLKEDYICIIKKEEFEKVTLDENGDCSIKVEFRNRDDFWKGGWYIDGGCLREISQKEIDDEIKEKDTTI